MNVNLLNVDIDGFVLPIPANSSLCIFGENNTGKTELLRRIYKKGRGVVYRGITTGLNDTEKQLFKGEIGYFDGTLNRYEKEKELSEIIILTAAKLQIPPAELLNLFDIDTREIEVKLKNAPHLLKAKLALADILGSGYKMILLDDVFGLDYRFKRSLIPAMKKIKADKKFELIIATADIDMASLTDKTAVLERGKVIEYGSTEIIKSEACHPYVSWLMSTTEIKRDKHITFIRTDHDLKLKRSCKWAADCPKANNMCTKKLPLYTETKAGTKAYCHHVK